MSQSTDHKYDITYSLPELAAALLKDKGIHEGLFAIGVEISMGVGAVNVSPTERVPGAMFGIKGVGLQKVEKLGPSVVDAAKVNPRPRAVAKPRSRVAAR